MRILDRKRTPNLSWPQYRLRLLIVAPIVSAAFYLGYSRGLEKATDLDASSKIANFDELMKLINETIVPDEWESVDGLTLMQPTSTYITVCPAAAPDGESADSSRSDLQTHNQSSMNHAVNNDATPGSQNADSMLNADSTECPNQRATK